MTTAAKQATQVVEINKGHLQALQMLIKQRGVCYGTDRLMGELVAAVAALAKAGV